MWHHQAVSWSERAHQQQGSAMNVTRLSLAEIPHDHVTPQVESIDRIYLNIYIPNLQRESGASWFLKQQRKYPVASSAAMAPYIKQAAGQEGIVLIGKAQEKTNTFRTTKGHGPLPGYWRHPVGWSERTTVCGNVPTQWDYGQQDDNQRH